MGTPKARNSDDKADEARPDSLMSKNASSTRTTSNSKAGQDNKTAGETVVNPSKTTTSQPAGADALVNNTALGGVKNPAAMTGTTAKEVPVVAPAMEAKYGVLQNQTCADYVAKFWKVGAFTREEHVVRKFIFSATLTMRTTVTAVTGTKVTIKSEFDAPDTADDQTGENTFDACTEGYKTSVPSSFTDCTVNELGMEEVSVEGKTYNARKVEIIGCSDPQGKTLNTTAWRVEDAPLWGIIKREAQGTYIPDKVDGRLSPTTKQFSFN